MVELSSCAPAVPPRHGAEISVVPVTTLRERLRTAAESELLSLLANSDSLIEHVNIADVRCAMVSYRQEKGFLDEFTLDGEALAGIMAACEKLAVDYLWLDAWCYRTGPTGSYDHDHFCQTLHSVLEGVRAVVWLPRSRQGSRGEYAYRLWCTFEAANVAQRRLPVAVAGAGMSGFQRQVQRFGSFTPAFTADGTLDELAKLNLCAYMGVLGPIVLAATSTVDGKADHCYSVSFADEQCIYQYESAAIAMFLWLLWLAGRAALASQVRLAKNARVVLRTMSLAGSPRRAQHSSANKLLRSPTLETASDRQVDVAPHAVFLRELPWLPTHDHRDVLVVQELLARSCPDLQPCPQAVRALALSAYIAARQRPAAGDATAGSLSLRAWLSERGIRLVPAGELTGLTWFDGVECSTAPEQDGLPLRALKDLGWIIARGMRCSLLTPLGVIKVASPMESKWTLVNAAFLHRHHPGVGKAVAGLLATTGLVAILISVLQVLLASHPSENRMILHSSPPYAASATACFVLPLPFCALLLQQLWQTDFTVVRNGHMPLPFAVFDHPLKTLIAAVACAAACSVEVCFAWIDSKQIAGATGWAVAGHAVRTTVETLLSVALLYEFMLITVHLMFTSSPVIISLCQRLCGKPSTDWAARDGILC